MTVAKAGLITVGLVGAIALGVATAPTIEKNWSKMHTRVSRAAEPSGPAAPAARRPHAAPPPARDATAGRVVKKESNTIEAISVSAWQPEFRNRVKAVLNPGAKPEIAAADFDNAEQFLTVAHAARNTQVPFMVLKDRVLNQGQSLTQAIHEFKPDLDARAEVTRARQAARADLETIG